MVTKSDLRNNPESVESILPEGWSKAAIGDVIVKIQNINPKDNLESEFGYVDISSICNKSYKVIGHKTYKGKEAPSRARRPIKEMDILFSNVRTYLRNIAIVTDELEVEVCSTGFTVLRSNGAVVPQFLFRYLLTDNFIAQVTPKQTGTHYPATSDSVVFQQFIPLPPLVEQHRIVSKVEELLAGVNSARERLGKVPGILKRFRQSVLAAACSGRLTADWREKHSSFESPEKLLERIIKSRLSEYDNLCRMAEQTGKKKPRKPSNLKPQMHHPEIEMALPDSWFWTSIENIASTKHYAMSSGPFGSSLGKKDYRNSGIPVIRGQNIQERSFVLNNMVYITQEKAVELIRSSAYPSDIIVVAVGSSGQTAIVPENLPWAILSQNCNKITLDNLFISPKYILYCLQNNIAKEQLHKKTTDTARPFLSLTNLKKTIVPIPPLEEQHEIFRRVEALFRLAGAIEARVAAGAIRAEKLTQAILAKAFRGELVPTEAELARREGRDFEPAAGLLSRIKEERRLITEAQPRRKTLKGQKQKTTGT